MIKIFLGLISYFVPNSSFLIALSYDTYWLFIEILFMLQFPVLVKTLVRRSFDEDGCLGPTNLLIQRKLFRQFLRNIIFCKKAYSMILQIIFFCLPSLFMLINVRTFDHCVSKISKRNLLFDQ